jgi:hypothetical protein
MLMYLHVGNNRNIRVKDIVGIFDADSATVSSITKKYLSEADSDGSVDFASEEIPKSFVLYKDKENKYRICFSQLSSSALYGRIGTYDGTHT